jgi:hypothetical protein
MYVLMIFRRSFPSFITYMATRSASERVAAGLDRVVGLRRSMRIFIYKITARSNFPFVHRNSSAAAVLGISISTSHYFWAKERHWAQLHSEWWIKYKPVLLIIEFKLIGRHGYCWFWINYLGKVANCLGFSVSWYLMLECSGPTLLNQGNAFLSFSFDQRGRSLVVANAKKNHKSTHMPHSNRATFKLHLHAGPGKLHALIQGDPFLGLKLLRRRRIWTQTRRRTVVKSTFQNAHARQQVTNYISLPTQAKCRHWTGEGSFRD